MGNNEVAIGSKFVKIMMHDFMERMKLPSDYGVKLKHEKSKRAILKTPKGTWEMDVRRDDDGEIFFEDGWPRFAHDHALNVLDFLAFEHTGNLHFNVVVCDAATACEKPFLADCRNHQQNHAKNKGKAEKETVESLHSQRPSFTKEMKSCAASKIASVTIPIGFARSNNLAGEKYVILRDPRKGRWPINLVVQHDPTSRVLMCGGWRRFFVANELKIGDFCKFELNPPCPTSATVVFDVQIVSCNR